MQRHDDSDAVIVVKARACHWQWLVDLTPSGPTRNCHWQCAAVARWILSRLGVPWIA